MSELANFSMRIRRFLKRSGSSSRYVSRSCGLRLSGPEMDAKTWSTLLENAFTDNRLSTLLQLVPSCGGVSTCQRGVDVLINSIQVYSPPNHHKWVDTFLEILLPLVVFVERAEV